MLYESFVSETVLKYSGLIDFLVTSFRPLVHERMHIHLFFFIKDWTLNLTLSSPHVGKMLNAF